MILTTDQIITLFQKELRRDETSMIILSHEKLREKLRVAEAILEKIAKEENSWIALNGLEDLQVMYFDALDS